MTLRFKLNAVTLFHALKHNIGERYEFIVLVHTNQVHFSEHQGFILSFSPNALIENNTVKAVEMRNAANF